MNLLSHYYLDKDHPSVYFKLGVVFPDMLRGFNQKLRRQVFPDEPLIPEEKALKNGILRHYQVDKIFHNLQVFEQLNAEVLNMLATNTQIRHRAWYLAHIIPEMLIDKALQERDTQIAASFYADLRKVNEEVVYNYLSRLGRQHIATEFFGNFNKFIEAKYLYLYTDDEKFARAALNAFNRACGVPFTQQDVRGVMLTSQTLQQRHATLLQEVFDLVGSQI